MPDLAVDGHPSVVFAFMLLHFVQGDATPRVLPFQTCEARTVLVTALQSTAGTQLPACAWQLHCMKSAPPAKSGCLRDSCIHSIWLYPFSSGTFKFATKGQLMCSFTWTAESARQLFQHQEAMHLAGPWLGCRLGRLHLQRHRIRITAMS